MGAGTQIPRSLAAYIVGSARSSSIKSFVTGSYLIALSLTLELDGPEGLGVATRDVLGHVVRDWVSVAAALRLVQLECTGTIVDAVAGIDEGVDSVGRNANLGAASDPSRIGGELLVVEERRDSVVSAVTLGACERVEVENTASAAVRSGHVRISTHNTGMTRETYPASIWAVGTIGLATVAAMNMVLARTEIIWRGQRNSPWQTIKVLTVEGMMSDFDSRLILLKREFVLMLF